MSSVRISRVPTYSGFRSLFHNFAYGTVTLFDLSFNTVRLSCPMLNAVLTPQVLLPAVWAPPISLATTCSDFARHYFRNRFYFLFLRVLRCFSSPGSPRIPMCSEYGNTTLLVLSSLIRTSADLKMFAPPRSFSQLTTSFFGAIYQGILREPFVA